MDAHRVGREKEPAIALKIEPSELTSRWESVGVEDASAYAPGNTPVEVPERANRTVAFGRVKSRDKALGANECDVANIEDGMADNDNDGEDGTKSRGTVDSTRVEGMPLTVSSGPPLSDPQSNLTESLCVNDDAENSKSSV